VAGRPRDPGRTTTSRVLAILAAFERGPEPLTLSEIADRSGQPLSTVHRLVGELQDWGALQRDDSGYYQIGLRLWELGQHAGRQLRDVARPFLQDLFEVTGESVHLAVRKGTEVLYIDRVYGSRRVPQISRVGGRLPLHPTAVGKVLLAYEEDWFREAYLADTLERRTPYTITEPGRLARELAGIRQLGYATTQEEVKLGSCSLAVPVLDADGQVVASVGIILQSNRSAEISRLVAPLRGTARKIELAYRTLPSTAPERMARRF
jgi:DNA-binding IclR family transcriptional regulator